MTDLAPAAHPSNRPLLVLAHGWGFDAGVWDEVRSRLPEGDHVAIDVGYFGGATPFDPPAGRPLVAVGHSHGVMTLLARGDVDRWAGFVAINGFPRFSWDESFPDGVRRRVIERMIQRFDEDPVAVLSEFRARCGVTDPLPSRLDTAALLDGLRSLRDDDVRASAARLAAPKLMLATGDDPIVSAAMTRASADGMGRDTMIEWRETGGHALPLTAPDWCAGRILAFVAGLEGDFRP